MNDIRDISLAEIQQFLLENGEKPFRAKQIREWLWKKGIRNFDEMSNLSVALRDKLKAHFTFKTTSIKDEIESTDQTIKFLFQLHDGELIEGVLIPSQNRVTACLSSQAGCPLGCIFCATGSMGFKRNLHYAEIFDQFNLMNEKSVINFGREISNIVYMGMGEPLLNYENVMTSVDILTSPDGKALSPSRITLSTVGIVKGIRQLAHDRFKPGLAVSLHSADETVRRKLIPAAKNNSLEDLRKALEYFVEKSNERITFEYLLLQGINDSIKDAEKLAVYCRAFPVKINLIEYNNTGTGLQGSSKENIEIFSEFLKAKNMIVNIRRSKGQDISAACGQLVRKY